MDKKIIPGKKPKHITYTLRMTNELYQQIKKISSEEDRSVNYVIIKNLEYLFNNKNNK